MSSKDKDSNIVAMLTDGEMVTFKALAIERAGFKHATEAVMEGLKSIGEEMEKRKVKAWERLTKKHGLEGLRYSVDHISGEIAKSDWQ